MGLNDHHDIQVGKVYVQNRAVYDRRPAPWCSVETSVLRRGLKHRAARSGYVASVGVLDGPLAVVIQHTIVQVTTRTGVQHRSFDFGESFKNGCKTAMALAYFGKRWERYLEFVIPRVGTQQHHTRAQVDSEGRYRTKFFGLCIKALMARSKEVHKQQRAKGG